MTEYAIKVVPAGWEHTMPLPFTKAAYDQSGIEQGTRVLIYRQDEGIVGEGEVHGFVVQPRAWPQDDKSGLPLALADADYLQPIGVLYMRDSSIPPQVVRETLGDLAFPLREDWQPLSSDQYHTLTDWP
jgi:hypothetical protein